MNYESLLSRIKYRLMPWERQRQKKPPAPPVILAMIPLTASVKAGTKAGAIRFKIVPVNIIVNL